MHIFEEIDSKVGEGERPGGGGEQRKALKYVF